MLRLLADPQASSVADLAEARRRLQEKKQAEREGKRLRESQLFRERLKKFIRRGGLL